MILAIIPNDLALILITKKNHYTLSVPVFYIPVWKYPFLLYACVLSHFSHVWLFVTLWTVALQAPLSMEFSRQE